MKVVFQFGLEKLLRIVKAGADGADGAADNVANLLVTQSVDFVERDDRAVFRGKFLKGVVQLFLQLVHERVFVGIGVGDELFDETCGVIFFAHFFETEEAAKLVLSQMSERGIHRDAIEPSEEAGLGLEATNRLKCFNEGVLSEV